MQTKNDIINKVKHCVIWWLNQRIKKLEEQLDESMSTNPFMMPFLFDYHAVDSFDDLINLCVDSHLFIGHATGFGKLIDEKILPHVFGTQKLDKAFRGATKPFNNSCFDEIDHYIRRADGKRQLLSLKAGKWTIQLTMAVKLNTDFNEILKNHGEIVDEIVVGVFYGKKEDLTDKYDILRGINRGANHSVIDLTSNVSVRSGREFWAWLNNGELGTQEWVIDGIITALKEEKIHEKQSVLLKAFKKGVFDKYEIDIKKGNELDWYKILKKING